MRNPRLLITAIAFVLAMSDRPLPDGVIVFAIGAGGGVAVVQIIELALAVARKRDSAQIGAHIIMIVAVVASSRASARSRTNVAMTSPSIFVCSSALC